MVGSVGVPESWVVWSARLSLYEPKRVRLVAASAEEADAETAARWESFVSEAQKAVGHPIYNPDLSGWCFFDAVMVGLGGKQATTCGTFGDWRQKFAVTALLWAAFTPTALFSFIEGVSAKMVQEVLANPAPPCT